MAFSKILFILCLGVLTSRRGAEAGCKACSSISSAACLSLTEFEMCFDGETLSGQRSSCASDEVCTELPGICKKADTNVATCTSSCHTCVSGFACVSKTEYSVCGSDDKPAMKLPCPDNKICNMDSFTSSKTICVSTCDKTPSCDIETNPETDYKKSCSTSSTTGFHPNLSDPTCKTYVFCQVMDGNVYSILYTCATGYFDSTQGKCVAAKPIGCS